MLKKLASDALGLSDIGKIIPPSDYDKVESDDYIFSEEQEKIFFLIKSKSDEYCFTNNAVIHLDGESAISKKRALKRYPYKDFDISNVWIETAGTVDLDVEIKFKVGSIDFSIDVAKKQLEQLKDLYKALFKISSIQKTNSTYLEYGMKSLNLSASAINKDISDANLVNQFEQLHQYISKSQLDYHEIYVREDYSEVFELYINQ